MFSDWWLVISDPCSANAAMKRATRWSMQGTDFIVGDGCGVVNAAGESGLVGAGVPSVCKSSKKVAIRKCFLVCCERVSSISNIWVASRNA
jgi:hypothetical protein